MAFITAYRQNSRARHAGAAGTKDGYRPGRRGFSSYAAAGREARLMPQEKKGNGDGETEGPCDVVERRRDLMGAERAI